MKTKTSLPIEDLELVQSCLEEGSNGIISLQQSLASSLSAALKSFGASDDEVEEVLAQLWADCVVADPPRRPLLERFDGRASLRTWLSAITINRWISLKRRQSLHFRTIEKLTNHEDGDELDFDPMATEERAVIAMLESAVREAFAACGAEEIVILQLVHMHGISQREIAALWSCHESSVSRLINNAEENIARAVLEAVRRRDPWLHLKWEDFLRLCNGINLLVG